MSLEAVGGRGGGGGGGSGLFISIPLSSLLLKILLLFSPSELHDDVIVVVLCRATAIPTGMFVLESSIEDTESGEVTVSLLSRFLMACME